MPADDQERDGRAELLAWWEGAAAGIREAPELDAAAEALARPGDPIGIAAREVIAERLGNIDLYDQNPMHPPEEAPERVEVGELHDWERLLLALTLAMLPAGRYWLSRSLMANLRDGYGRRMHAPIGLYGKLIWVPVAGGHTPDFFRLTSLTIIGADVRRRAEAGNALAALAGAFRRGLALQTLALVDCAVDIGVVGEVATFELINCAVESAPPPSRQLIVTNSGGAGLSRLVSGSAGRASTVIVDMRRQGARRHLHIGAPGPRYNRLRLYNCVVVGDIAASTVTLDDVELRGSLTAGAVWLRVLTGAYRLAAGAVTLRNDRGLAADWLGGAVLAASANDAPGAGSAIVAPRIFGLARDTPVAGRLRVAGFGLPLEGPPVAAALQFAYEFSMRPGAIDPASPATVRSLRALRELPGGGRPRVVRASALGNIGGEFEVLCLAGWSGPLLFGPFRAADAPPVRAGLLAVVGDAADIVTAARWMVRHPGSLTAARVLAVVGGEVWDAAELAAAAGGAAAGGADRARLAALGWLSSPIVAAWPDGWA